MRSKDIENAITDLNEFLKSKHPSSVLQFIPGMIIGWTYFGTKRQPSKSDIENAWKNYFKLLRKSIDRRLSFVSSQTHPNMRMIQKISGNPPYVYEKEKLNEIIALLGNMPPKDALDFIVEVTTRWCFSLPINFLPLLPDPPRDESDESIANAIYEWLIKYYDLWH